MFSALKTILLAAHGRKKCFYNSKIYRFMFAPVLRTTCRDQFRFLENAALTPPLLVLGLRLGLWRRWVGPGLIPTSCMFLCFRCISSPVATPPFFSKAGKWIQWEVHIRIGRVSASIVRRICGFCFVC